MNIGKYVRLLLLGGGLSWAHRAFGKYAFRYRDSTGRKTTFRSDSPRQLVAAARTLSADSLVWYSGLSRLMPNAKKDLVFDFGANIGYSGLLFLETFGSDRRIFMLEPHLGNVSQLVHHFRFSNRVAILPVGVGDQSVVTSLAVPAVQGNRSDSESNTGLLSTQGVAQKSVFSGDISQSPTDFALLLEADRLSRAILQVSDCRTEEELYGRVAFCKIDIEGSESYLLHFMSRILAAGALVQIEWNQVLNPSNEDSLWDSLVELQRVTPFGIYSVDGLKSQVTDFFLIPQKVENDSSDKLARLRLVKVG